MRSSSPRTGGPSGEEGLRAGAGILDSPDRCWSWCAAWVGGPLREGGREEEHYCGACGVSLTEGAGPVFTRFVFSAAEYRPSLVVWAGAAQLERLSCHQTHFSPRVSRCHRAGGLVPGVWLWSLSPLQSDRIWLPSLRLVSGFLQLSLLPLLSPSPIVSCPSYCTPPFPWESGQRTRE